MKNSLVTKSMKNSILVALSISSMICVSYAENSAQDLGGVSMNMIRQINTLKADQNKDLRNFSNETNNKFGAIAQAGDSPNKLEIPQLSVIGDGGALPVKNVSKAVPEGSDQSENLDGSKEVNKLLTEYKELKTLVGDNVKSRSQISDNKKLLEFDLKMLRLRQVGKTLGLVPDQYFDSNRPDFNAELDEIRLSLDEKGRSRWDGFMANEDKDLLEKLKISDEKADTSNSEEASETGSDVEEVSRNSDTDPKSDDEAPVDKDSEVSEADSESAEINTELSGLELIRSKCSGSVGSKNGAALVKHLTDGECGKAINENPELKVEYNLTKIVELISAWGFRTASFSSATNMTLGINKLPELGISFDQINTQAGFKSIPYQPAVEVQQTQQLITQDESSSGRLKELMPRDKAVVGHSVRD